MRLKGAEKQFWWNFARITDSSRIPTEISGYTSIDAEDDDDHFKQLFDKVKVVHSIYLKQTRVTDETVKMVSQVKQLKSLTLMKHPGITAASLPYLNKLTDLEYLDIWRTGIILEDVHHLKSLKKLKQLYVSPSREECGGSYPEVDREYILELVIGLEDLFPDSKIYVDFELY